MRTATSALLLAAALGSCHAQQYVAFTQLSSNGLDGTSDPVTQIGPEDHIDTCNGNIVFVDIDSNTGNLLTSTDNGQSWAQQPLSMSTCPDGLPLYPRDSGYTLSRYPNSPINNQDRLVIIGGDDQDSDVWVSDDCGVSWTCLDAPEEWTPRDFSWAGHIPSVPGTFYMGGGVTTGLISVGMFQTTDGGNTWVRPPCTPAGPATCNFPFDSNYSSFVLPDAPSTGGMYGTDGSTLYFWDDWNSGDPNFIVFYLNSSNINSGWAPLQNADIGSMYGRKVWLSAQGNPNAGCWFSTDYDSDDLYVLPRIAVNSMNTWSVATTAAGPWRVGGVPASWPPRASAFLLNHPTDPTQAIFGGGMTFNSGQPSQPTFGDVWSINSGVCILGPNGQLCNGQGAADTTNLVCACNSNWQGDAVCGSCTNGIAYGPTCALCPTSTGDGSPCNSATGHGNCDPQQGCVCSTGWFGTVCDTCAANYYGPNCQACLPCNPIGGTCDGSGTTGGSGSCVCTAGYAGADCYSCQAGFYGPYCDQCSPCNSAGGTCDGSGTTNGTGTCVCNPGWFGADCSTCDSGYYGATCSQCQPCNTAGGTCDGSGTTGGSGACECNTGWAGNDCSSCQTGFYGGSCAACSPCNPAGGSCDGSGTTGGTGQCICTGGYTGSDCSIPPAAPSATSTPSAAASASSSSGGSPNNAPAGGPPAVDPGLAAGASIGVLAVAGLGFFMVRRAGGLSAALNSSGRGRYAAVPTERASLMSATGARAPAGLSSLSSISSARLSSEQAASRFSGLGQGSGDKSPLRGSSGAYGGFQA